MKRIKLLTKTIIGNVQTPKGRGWIGDVEPREADALIAIGYAKLTNEEPTEPAPNEVADNPADEVENEQTAKSAKDKGGAPENKAKAK